MAIQFKRGTTNNRTNYTPSVGELIVIDVDQTNPSIYVGDGSTAGGKLVSASSSGSSGAQNAFTTVTVVGQSDIVADSATDTLGIIAGTNISITTSQSGDALTINNTFSQAAETDPIFSIHVSAGITGTKITSWDNAFGWGNHAALGYLSSGSSINALTDVDTSTTAPTNNQVLAWDGNNWVPATSTAGTTLSGLVDTDTSNASTGKILEYSNGTWVIGNKGGGSGSTTLTGLSDTPTNYTSKANFFAKVNSNATGLDFVDLIASSPLSFNRTTNTLTISADTDDISEATNLYYTNDRVNTLLGTKGYLEDSDFTSIGLMKRGAAAGSYSIVTDSSTNWNTAYSWGDHSTVGYLTSISALSINALSDVATTNEATNEILRWNGSNWVNSGESAGITVLTGLTDTPANYGTSGQVLSSTGSGTQWVDQASGGSSSGLQDIADDLTPQLGGDLDVQARNIVTSTVNGNITIVPNGTGHLELGSTNIVTIGEIYFGNTFTNEAGLPNATTYDGMFAIADDIGTAYYSHDTAWVKLLDQSGDQSISGSLTIDNLKLNDNTITTDTDTLFTDGIKIDTAGDNKIGMYMYKGITAVDNSNLTEIFVKGLTNNRVTLIDNSTKTFDIMITAKRYGMSAGNEKTGSWNFKGCVVNDGGTTGVLGTIMKTVFGKTDSIYDCTVDVINEHDALRIRVQGKQGESIKWMAVVNTIEVTV